MAQHDPIMDAAARRRLVKRFGPAVEPWCDDLPATVAALADRWGLRVRSGLVGNTSRALLCDRADGTSAVLKLTPDPAIAAEEHAALSAWSASPQLVSVLDADLPLGALLLEAIEPGGPLARRPGGVPLRWMGVLLRELHAVPVPAEPEFPPLTAKVDAIFSSINWQRLAGEEVARHLPVDLVERSRNAALDLAEYPARALLHGDLHADNVLDGGPDRGLVAIDPRPCVGDPAFDAVDFAFLRVTRSGDFDRRVASMVRYTDGLDGDRLVAWCRTIAVFFAIRELRRSGPSERSDTLLALAKEAG
ncbi:aminoglycoside phosphotransferase family protein [Solihabitans fulvus]|nr:aminoglycoside phosphotransferase family protein [Solihabitans fulvus]